MILRRGWRHILLGWKEVYAGSSQSRAYSNSEPGMSMRVPSRLSHLKTKSLKARIISVFSF